MLRTVVILILICLATSLAIGQVTSCAGITSLTPVPSGLQPATTNTLLYTTVPRAIWTVIVVTPASASSTAVPRVQPKQTYIRPLT